MNANDLSRPDGNAGTTPTFARLALALANDYESIYVLSTEDGSYVEYAAENSDRALTVRSSGSDFYADSVKNCRIMVHPDDQEHFLRTLSRENLLDVLDAEGKSFIYDYRLMFSGGPQFYALKAIRGSGADSKFIILGIRNVDEVKRRELAAEAVNRTYSEIAASLAGLYEVIYHVDINTGEYTEYSAGDGMDTMSLRTKELDFFASTPEMIKAVVHPDDMAKVAEAVRRENLLKALDASTSVSIEYRHFVEGSARYVRLSAIRQQSDSGYIVIGVRDVDEQTRKQHAEAAERQTYSQIAMALASKYEVIYYINTETDVYTQYSSSKDYADLGTTTSGSDFFGTAANDIRTYIHKDDAQWLLKALDKTSLLRELQENGSVDLTYRQLLGNRLQYVRMTVVMPRNCTDHIIIGVANVDEQVRREMEMAERSKAFREIMDALAHTYEVIYQVDINTNEYKEYTSSQKYQRLQEGMAGRDFFAETQRNMERDIYPDDLPMMREAMKKKNLLKVLDESGRNTISYRLMLEGRAQYVTLSAVKPDADSDHIIIAVSNVDEAKRREIAFKEALGSAMDMANRDALTGVKNKHAYVQAEIEYDRLISENNCHEFAVVVADINGLKHMNDTQGHSAGDDFIKAACMMICKTFQHSPVFRIGGDEFVALLRGGDYEDREALMKLLGDKVRNHLAQGLVTVAAGISCYVKGTDMHLQDVFERADKLMYDDKQRFKYTR
ncbi:MAG: GGDEF domain-containing protein [Ruminococcus sp.]|nr:GGDEF domain-containing protein [Ruminococcus sp.]